LSRRITPAHIKAFFEGMAKVIGEIKGDPWVVAKAVLIITLAFIVGPVFNVGIGQNTPFVVLACVFIAFIIAFVILLRLARKSERR